MAELGPRDTDAADALAYAVSAMRAPITSLAIGEGVAFAPRYYCPRCGPTNRIMSAHGRLICVVCDYDLAQMIEQAAAYERKS